MFLSLNCKKCGFRYQASIKNHVNQTHVQNHIQFHFWTNQGGCEYFVMKESKMFACLPIVDFFYSFAIGWYSIFLGELPKSLILFRTISEHGFKGCCTHQSNLEFICWIQQLKIEKKFFNPQQQCKYLPNKTIKKP